jgi:hypothetical protein
MVFAYPEKNPAERRTDRLEGVHGVRRQFQATATKSESLRTGPGDVEGARWRPDQAMVQPRVLQLNPKVASSPQEEDFSLVLGGPLYQLYLATRLARPHLELVVRRMLAASLICWLPLLVLAAVAGQLTSGAPIPFLRDPEVHIRFLVALPMLIASEVFVHDRMRNIVSQFLSRNIIASEDRPHFEKLIASAMSLRNSVVIEIVLLVATVPLGAWLSGRNFALHLSSWFQNYDPAGSHLTAGGWYYVFVSLAIFRFILLRWYFRLFIWYRFLWQVRAIPLHFNLFHPDRAGGIGFLSSSTDAFTPVFVAQTAVVAGTIFTQIRYTGEKLPQYLTEITGVLIFVVLTLTFPLGFFFVQLQNAARRAKREFGILASSYVDDFHRKWIEGRNSAAEPLLGTSDIQSLADLANSFEVISRIRMIPISKEVLSRLVINVAIPFLPLIFTMVPLAELLEKVLKIMF